MILGDMALATEAFQSPIFGADAQRITFVGGDNIRLGFNPLFSGLTLKVNSLAVVDYLLVVSIPYFRG